MAEIDRAPKINREALSAPQPEARPSLRVVESHERNDILAQVGDRKQFVAARPTSKSAGPIGISAPSTIVKENPFIGGLKVAALLVAGGVIVFAALLALGIL